MWVSRFFSLAAWPYDVLMSQDVWRSHIRTLLPRFPEQAIPHRVLDLGCGPGNSTLELVRAGARHVVGVDLAHGMLRLARRRVRGSGEFDRMCVLRADATRLPVAAGSFDAVTGHSFLYLVPDPAAVLVEARRALRPGGRIVLMEPAAGAPGWDLVPQLLQSARFAVSMALWRVVSSVARRYTDEELRAALEGAGFVGVTVERTLGGLGLVATGTQPA